METLQDSAAFIARSSGFVLSSSHTNASSPTKSIIYYIINILVHMHLCPVFKKGGLPSQAS